MKSRLTRWGKRERILTVGNAARRGSGHVRWSFVALGVALLSSVLLIVISSSLDGATERAAVSFVAGVLGGIAVWLAPAVRAILVDAFKRPTKATVMERSSNGKRADVTIRALDETRPLVPHH